MKKLTKAEQTQLKSLIDRAHANLQSVPGLFDFHSETKQEPAPPVDAVKSVLNERGARYGDFTDHARLAQQLVDAMRLHEVPAINELTFIKTRRPWDELSSVQRQALTVIADKQARILNGDPNYDDNWIDIQGYARLVQERLPQSGTSPE